jgi:hypothetical protein
MCDTARLFNCARCGRQVVICSCGDRGNCYPIFVNLAQPAAYFQ